MKPSQLHQPTAANRWEQAGRIAWFGLGAATGLWLTMHSLWPARMAAARLTAITGTRPVLAEISWRYGRGVLPASVIFDLVWEHGASGSVTVDGDAWEAEIPFGSTLAGPYTLTAHATYRILSRPQTLVYRFRGTV